MKTPDWPIPQAQTFSIQGLLCAKQDFVWFEKCCLVQQPKTKGEIFPYKINTVKYCYDMTLCSQVVTLRKASKQSTLINEC